MNFTRLPSKAQILEELTYNPETGQFFWRFRAQGRRFNKEAGSISTGGYRKIELAYTKYAAHRLAWVVITGKPPEYCIDHINGNQLDNRACNLREATHVENALNQPISVLNTTGVKNVSCHKQSGLWKGKINYQTKYFKTLQLAQDWVELQRNQQGEFANTNK